MCGGGRDRLDLPTTSLFGNRYVSSVVGDANHISLTAVFRGRRFPDVCIPLSRRASTRVEWKINNNNNKKSYSTEHDASITLLTTVNNNFSLQSLREKTSNPPSVDMRPTNQRKKDTKLLGPLAHDGRFGHFGRFGHLGHFASTDVPIIQTAIIEMC